MSRKTLPLGFRFTEPKLISHTSFYVSLENTVIRIEAPVTFVGVFFDDFIQLQIHSDGVTFIGCKLPFQSCKMITQASKECSINNDCSLSCFYDNKGGINVGDSLIVHDIRYPLDTHWFCGEVGTLKNIGNQKMEIEIINIKDKFGGHALPDNLSCNHVLHSHINTSGIGRFYNSFYIIQCSESIAQPFILENSIDLNCENEQLILALKYPPMIGETVSFKEIGNAVHGYLDCKIIGSSDISIEDVAFTCCYNLQIIAEHKLTLRGCTFTNITCGIHALVGKQYSNLYLENCVFEDCDIYCLFDCSNHLYLKNCTIRTSRFKRLLGGRCDEIVFDGVLLQNCSFRDGFALIDCDKVCLTGCEFYMTGEIDLCGAKHVVVDKCKFGLENGNVLIGKHSVMNDVICTGDKFSFVKLDN